MIEKDAGIWTTAIASVSPMIGVFLIGWVAIKKYLNFDKATKERDIENVAFKKEVEEKVATQSKEIATIRDNVTELRESTKTHIDIRFKAQDEHNTIEFPKAELVWLRFDDIESKREALAKEVLTRLDKTDSNVVLILKKMDDEQQHKIQLLEKENAALRNKQ